jgi:hypothetical protein
MMLINDAARSTELAALTVAEVSGAAMIAPTWGLSIALFGRGAIRHKIRTGYILFLIFKMIVIFLP